MSKYAVQYPSSSKGLVNIEDMITPHLLNAWRKQRDAMLSADSTDDPIYKAMSEELHARGGQYDGATDKWEMPPRDAEVEPREDLVQ